MSAPKAFYSYLENEEKLNKLSDEQAGRLYKALYSYSRTGSKPDLSDDPLLDYAFADFVLDVDRDRENYEKTCKRRAEAGKKGGRPKGCETEEKANGLSEKAKKANGFSKNQAKAKESKKSETEVESEAETDNISHDILNRRVRPDFDTRAQKVLDDFKAICTSFIPPEKLTEHRKRLIYQAELDKTDFAELFRKAEQSDFLSGRVGGTCKFGFDWVLDQKNRTKIMEGNFDNAPPKPKKGGAMFTMQGASFDIAALEDRGLFDD